MYWWVLACYWLPTWWLKPGGCQRWKPRSKLLKKGLRGLCHLSLLWILLGFPNDCQLTLKVASAINSSVLLLSWYRYFVLYFETEFISSFLAIVANYLPEVTWGRDDWLLLIISESISHHGRVILWGISMCGVISHLLRQGAGTKNTYSLQRLHP